jgi:ABC-2 type transport system ATP-binding protein
VAGDDASVWFGQKVALSELSCSFGPGVTGLLGPNGAGKTTLMRILAGLLAPTAGTIRMDGVDVTHRPELVWPRLGYLPQHFGFHPNLSGRTMLRYILELKGISHPAGIDALCGELLERVNMSHAADRAVKGYSGGMRQRLGIAQAIAGNPDLLIVDEPTVGLDPEERNRLYRLFAELAETRTVLLSTHLVEDVAILCSRFAVIREGRLVTTTTPSAARAAIDGTIFEGEVGRADLEILTARHHVTQALLVEGRNRVRLHAPDHVVPAGFVRTAPTLEDAYFVMQR